MGLFDTLKKAVQSEVKQAINSTTREAVNELSKGVQSTIHKAVSSKSEKFSFQALPSNLSELQALPEAKLDTPFKTVALTLAVLCNYEKDSTATYEMLDFLKGPENVSTFEKNFLSERLDGRTYKPYSFFAGATPQNGYQPTTPYTITVSDNPYSYPEENWATLYVQSTGADAPRAVKLRKKPSTGQWFVNDIQCLSDIRIPVAEDPWA